MKMEKHTKFDPFVEGNGKYSSAQDFPRQKANQVHELKELLPATISQHLELKIQPSLYRIADLGCYTGRHSFDVINIVTEAVLEKYRTQGWDLDIPEFLVLFNDLPSNDFNALFNNLPTDRQYFACGVPGFFHNRLFPKASLHLVYSSKAFHWLTKAPEELSDPNSPAYNAERIFYINAPTAVADAYLAQFSEDMESILNARNLEMVRGGLMVIVIPGRASGTNPAQYFSIGQVFISLEPILLDLAKEGIVSKSKLESFNVPQYYPSPEEMKNVIEKNGCFETVELIALERKILQVFSTEEMRLGFGGMLTKHFGIEITKEVFDRYEKDIPRLCLDIDAAEGNGVFLYVTIRCKHL